MTTATLAPGLNSLILAAYRGDTTNMRADLAARRESLYALPEAQRPQLARHIDACEERRGTYWCNSEVTMPPAQPWLPAERMIATHDGHRLVYLRAAMGGLPQWPTGAQAAAWMAGEIVIGRRVG